MRRRSTPMWIRLAGGIVAVLALTLPAAASAGSDRAKFPPPDLRYNVLVVTSQNDAVTQAGIAAIKAAGQTAHAQFKFFVNAPPAGTAGSQFVDKRLDKFRTVVFLDTGAASGLTADQQDAFERYFHRGGGGVFIGSAIETDPSWQFLTDILGARASGKLAVQAATVKVADRVHDATKDLPEYWTRTDAWYNFTTNVRGVSHVLDTVVEAPFGPQPSGQTLGGITGGTMGSDHPVSWCKDYKGGRSFYTDLGNTADSFDSGLTTHLKGAIDWAAGVSDVHYSDCGATVLANYQQVKVGQPNISEPIGFDQLPDGRIIQTDRRGGVHLHNFATGASSIIAQIPVYNNSEDGLYGGAIDNNFASDHWVYLYYAPLVVDNITYSDGTTGHTNDFRAAPFLNGTAPTQATDLSAFDPWIGYFQLSRFKFVDDAPGSPAHLDLTTEQQILRVSNNRGACCHVAGDIDFDKHNNLWMPTGDDSAAGSGDAGNWGQSIDQKTDENQTIRISSGATGGTFTLTFNGQTTAPIAFNANAAAIQSALGNLSNIGAANIQVTGSGTVNTANQLATWKGTFEEQDVPTLTSDATGLTGTTPTVTIGVGSGAGGSNTTARQGGLWRMPAADSGRSAMNTNDLRGKVLRIHVKDSDIASADANHADFGSGGAYTIPAGNLFPLVAGMPQLKTRPEVYAMGFRNPFRLQVDENDVAYVSDYSPDSQTPQQFHGPPGVGRFEIVRHPSNYGWPYCYGPNLPEYPWNVNLQVPMNLLNHQPVASGVTPQPYDCSNPAGVPNNDYWNLNGGPSVQAGLAVTPPLTQPDIWYSYRDNNTATPLGTPCFAFYGPDAPGTAVPGSTTSCPRLFPELFTGGVGPHGIAKYHYDPANPNPLKFPPYYDDSIVLGEFTQDTMRELKLDSQNRVFKINSFMPCGQANVANSPFVFECDNPMDLQWGADGDFYLLTYGDGFFNINADAGMYKWQYVKGTRAPTAVLTTDKTDGALPLTVNFSSVGSSDADPGDSITFNWDFGDGTTQSMDPNPAHTYTTRGRYTVTLTVTDSTGKSAGQSTVITAGNTSPKVTVTVPVLGGVFDFGDDIPFTVTVSDPEDGAIVCSEVVVTFVLGHDTHGHAEGGTTGCSGVLHTTADDVSHGGNVFGVISATYTDHGVGHDNVQTLSTTGQTQIRQKNQEVEFVVNQSGTNTATDNDGGPVPPPAPGVHRGSLAAGDWIQLNGPYNLVNVDSITFRVADAAAGRTAGSPLAAIEIHQDSLTGPIVQTDNLVSTGGTATWTSQTFPITLSGTHELYLVFRTVTGGATGGNLFNLNWARFGGAGVGTPH
jgi:PKD repeat protein